MKRFIVLHESRTYADGWLLWLIVVLGALLLALALAAMAAAGTAYYSSQGFLYGAGTTQFFEFDINPALRAPAPFSLRTWHYGGGTNAAGDTIHAGGFDPILQLWGSSGQIVQNDDGPYGRDSLIDWSTPGMPTQLAAGSYGVNLFPFSGEGGWAVDLLADAAKFTLTDAGFFSSTGVSGVDSLKLGSNDVRTPAKLVLALYESLELYHFGPVESGQLVVGNTGSASADIKGTLDTGHSVLGFDSDSIGSLILSAGGDWEDFGSYDATYIGYYGEGNLVVQANSSAQFDYNLMLAKFPGSEGNLTVSGSSARVEVFSNLEIGGGGVGTMRIDNQGYVDCRLVGNPEDDVVASLAGSTGTVDVDGYNSLWETDTLTVGDGGQGIVRITSGGKIDTYGNAFIGKTASASASSVTVAGMSPELTKSTWLVSRDLHIAGTASGPSSALNSSLAINSGGLVDVFGTTTVWNPGGSLMLLGGEMETGSLVVKPGATFTHSDGTLTINGGTFDPGTGAGNYVITGADSADRPKVVLSGGATGTLNGEVFVGQDNYGELLIENQATLSAVSLVSSVAGIAPSSSIITVTGANSRLVITGDSLTFPNQEPLLVGVSGPSQLNIMAGGQVQVQQGGVWLGCCSTGSPPHFGSGEIVVDGQNSRLDAKHFGWFAAGADSYVRIRERGVVHATDTNYFSHISPESSHTIDVAVNGTNSLLQIDGGLIISGYGMGGAGPPGTARLNIRNGGQTQVAHDVWFGGLNVGSSSGTSLVDVGGDATVATFQVGGNLYVGGYDQGTGGGTARLAINNNGLVNAANVKVWQPGTVELNGGIVSTGHLELAGGTLRGNGSVIVSGQLTNSGVVAPGLSAGSINVVGGDFWQDLAGTLEIEIGGTNPFQYDRLNVTSGRAVLSGTLALSLIDPTGGTNVFRPSAGDKFEIVTATGNVLFNISGTVIPVLRGGLLWSYILSPDSKSLSVGVVGVLGDYNRNGVVDAADYVFWRDLLDQPGNPWSIFADGDSDGVVDSDDYDVWRAHFGQIAVSATALGATRVLDAIPEPASFLLCVLGITCMFIHRFTRPTAHVGQWKISGSVAVLLLGFSHSCAVQAQCVCPTIESQPQSRTVSVGSDVTFFLEVSGTGPLTYQWSKDSTPITGATDSSHSIFDVQFADDGDYQAMSANPCGVAISDIASLTVIPMPLVGDYNQNGVVDATDYVVWRETYSGPNVPPVSLAADGDGDGDVDQGDFIVWRSRFGQTAGSGVGDSANAAVPEPVTPVMLIVGMLGMLLCQRAVVS